MKPWMIYGGVGFLLACWLVWADWGWEHLDRTTRKALSEEQFQGRTLMDVAAYWRNGKVEKVRIFGPRIYEVRYFDGRIEKQ